MIWLDSSLYFEIYTLHVTPKTVRDLLALQRWV
jgi:hypothetical protein